jgi:hypothetical protein
MSQAHEVQQHLDEVKSLRERLGTGRWQEKDWGLLERVLGSYERLLSMLCEVQITLKRLRRLAWGQAEAATRGRARPWRKRGQQRRGTPHALAGIARAMAALELRSTSGKREEAIPHHTEIHNKLAQAILW